MLTVPVERDKYFEFSVKKALGLILRFNLAPEAAFLSFVWEKAHELS